jgi:hypothetical protein
MLKLSLWLVAPPIVAFLASPQTLRLDNTLTVFALVVIALIVGIGPRLTNR